MRSELLSLQDLFSETIKYCVNCRQDLSECTALRCSRCKVVHYCSRECQKSNFSLHKSYCKKISALRLQLLNDDPTLAENEDKTKACQYELAYAILTLGYHSTDTIERGKSIYDHSLLEYHKLLRQDPFWVGACESVVLLLAILGYDGLCLSLISFMLSPPSMEVLEAIGMTRSEGGSLGREARIREFTNICSENPDDIWIYGPNDSNKSFDLSAYEKIRSVIPKQWGANVFQVPLMLVKMRQYARASISSSPVRTLKMMEIVEICRQVEYSADFLLPVLRSLFPDSRQRLGAAEVCGLLANTSYQTDKSYLAVRRMRGEIIEEEEEDGEEEDDDKPHEINAWENSCSLFWMMLKDCYAFTPGILDVVEETIEEMTKRGINVIAEDPESPTADEYMNFVSYMAERQRNGLSALPPEFFKDQNH
mmetsp:Transcript_2483/g.4252  ORF Transcript_2483/g.4252 Transcript_2483/m.4252 type:complete len:423 (+) Transcript_2483:202-1470(+)